MQFDDLTNEIFIVAVNEAKMQKHEYLIPEHFLYALLMFEEGIEMVERSGGNVYKIMEELQIYFNDFMNKNETGIPLESEDFSYIYNHAVDVALARGSNVVNVTDVLFSINTLPDCFGLYYMIKNGVDMEILLEMKDVVATTVDEEYKNKKEESVLEKYTTNITKQIKDGNCQKIIGREDEVNRTIQVLCRLTKNNPIHVGQTGVGKTSITECLAQRIVNGDVPDKLKNAQIYSLDVAVVLAGTKYRGDFEERVVKIFEELENEENSIVYIDEIHTIVGAGSINNNGVDMAGIMKKYLVNNKIKFIGATTFDEYKKYIEKDKTLNRRFQYVKINETNETETIQILNGIKEKYEQYHGVEYSEEIIKYIYILADKYIKNKYMPDKAIDVLDEVGTYVSLNYDKVEIDEDDVQEIVAKISGVPKENISQKDDKVLKNLEKEMNKVIYGQEEAIGVVVSNILAGRVGLKDENKPIASLLFVGQTGVGKTEIAKQTAKLFGRNLIRFDMSEYQERHSVAKLIGAPPGYVGYEEGGLLTDAVSNDGNCVLLLDEIEKAHKDIYNLLLQVFDYGVLTDSSNKKVHFNNCIIIMTSNAGAREIGKNIIGFENNKVGTENMLEEVNKVFAPEFRNRLDDIVVFNNIDKKIAVKITKYHMGKLKDTLKEKGVTLKYSTAVSNHIASVGLVGTYGAREIIRYIDKNIKKEIAIKLVNNDYENGVINVTVKNGEVVVE